MLWFTIKNDVNGWMCAFVVEQIECIWRRLQNEMLNALKCSSSSEAAKRLLCDYESVCVSLDFKNYRRCYRTSFKYLNVHFCVNGGCIFTQIQTRPRHRSIIYNRFVVVVSHSLLQLFFCTFQREFFIFVTHRSKQTKSQTEEKQ